MGFDPTEDAATLKHYQQQEGFPWQAYLGNRNMYEAYDIAIRDTKVAVNSKGLVVFRAGFGVQSTTTWKQVFQQLASSGG